MLAATSQAIHVHLALVCILYVIYYIDQPNRSHGLEELECSIFFLSLESGSGKIHHYLFKFYLFRIVISPVLIFPQCSTFDARIQRNAREGMAPTSFLKSWRIRARYFMGTMTSPVPSATSVAQVWRQPDNHHRENQQTMDRAQVGRLWYGRSIFQ